MWKISRMSSKISTSIKKLYNELSKLVFSKTSDPVCFIFRSYCCELVDRRHLLENSRYIMDNLNVMFLGLTTSKQGYLPNITENVTCGTPPSLNIVKNSQLFPAVQPSSYCGRWSSQLPESYLSHPTGKIAIILNENSISVLLKMKNQMLVQRFYFLD